MAFTKLTRIQHYTDIICIGASVDKKPYPYGERHCYENLHGFHTIQLKCKDGKCTMEGDAITWDCSDLFDCILNYIQCGRSPLIVLNHSLVCIGSSDFVGKLDRREIVLASSESNYEQFGYSGEGKVSTESFVSSAPPTILIFDHLHTGKRYTVVDIANYGAKYMIDIWDNLSKVEREAIHNEAELGVSEDNSLTCCTLIAMYMRKYYKLVHEHNLGGVSLTYSSQGMRAFRKRFYSDNICTHADKDARILEDRCYLGGRVQELYHGMYNGKVYLLDIQSLYPHLGTIKKFPTSLQDTQTSPSKGTIEQWLDSGIVFAHCHVESDLPAYPYKTMEGLTFPKGSYNAYLCADEFSDAWKTGCIRNVYKAQHYSADFILKPYSDFMLSLRTKYKGSSDRLTEFMAKCITNGLWGKFGQCGNVWMYDDKEQADRPYGGYYKFDCERMKKYQYRIIDWNVSKLEYAPFSDNTFIPISACMNAYSRHYIWRHMLQAGLNNVLYTCVDGLIVTQEGMDRLAWLIAPNPYIYGMYKVSEIGDSCCISGYGKYTIGNKVAYQGVPRYNSKQSRGFWSVLDDNDLMQTKEIYEGKEILTSYGSSDMRNKLMLQVNKPGSFTDPLTLHESPLLPFVPDSYQQDHLFHDSEWNS